MNGLLTSWTDLVVEPEELKAIPTPEPTRTWRPISHHRLQHEVKDSLRAQGFTLISEDHAVTHDGARYFAVMRVTHGYMSEAGDYVRALGIRSSLDKSIAVGLCFGSQVICCSNLSFGGDFTLFRRHSKYLLRDLPEMVDRAIGSSLIAWDDEDRRIESYRNAKLGDTQMHDLAVRSMDAGIICGSAIPKLLKEWREPQHEEFRPRTVWSAFNAYTEVFKAGNVLELSKRTRFLHELLEPRVASRAA